jgi:uncharacterized protein
VGIGLRWDFLDDLLERLDDASSRADLERVVPFWEVSPENYMRRGGYIPESLERVADCFPIITHGLQMSIGGVDAYDEDYFRQLRRFVSRFGTPWHSDHLCFCGTDGRILHDLFPMPQTEASALHCAHRVIEARDRLELPMAIENISFYLQMGATELEETDFLATILEAADCQLLLDVNNVYVNSLNHGFDPAAWLDRIDPARVVQLHIAGHEFRAEDGLTIDTHGSEVIEPVYELLSYAIAKLGPKPVLLERDNDVPDLDTLLAERGRVADAYERGLVQWRATQDDA